jgi:hypothetical protein
MFFAGVGRWEPRGSDTAERLAVRSLNGTMIDLSESSMTLVSKAGF